MTKRERVERTLRRQETDRVPICDLFRCDAAFEYFSGEKLPPLAEDEATQQELLRIVGKAVDGLLDMTRSVKFGPAIEKDVIDEYGFTIHHSVWEKTTWVAEKPFHDEKGAAAYAKKVIADTVRETKKLRRNPAAYGEQFRQDYLRLQGLVGDTVILLTTQSTGLDEIRNSAGLELFSYLQADQPGLISEFVETFTDYQIAICHAIADRELAPVMFLSGDIAYKGRLLHSPAFLRQEFFPRLQRIIAAWHEHDIVCMYHSDGYLMEVMEDLLVAGIDGLNPIETIAGMDLAELKRRYGDRLFFNGGIDMSQLLFQGTPEEVREVCRRAIEMGYPGYFLGSTTEINNSTRLENIIALYETARDTNLS